MTSSEKVILLDRDGVLNEDRSNYVLSLDQLKILEGVPDAIARLKKANYRVLVITNQACIGKGLITSDRLGLIHAQLARACASINGTIDGFYYCPHTNEDQCSCRKPMPGLIYQAQDIWQFTPSSTWFVGDSLRDVRAAQTAGCCPGLVLTGHGEKAAAQLPGIPRFAGLPAFVDFLLP